MRPCRRHRRGFTLVELIIAMAAGLIVALGAFILSKSATKFFQDEARVSSAQLAAILGVNRLAVDIQRAGYMSTANLQKDPMRCGDPALWPQGLKRLAGVRIIQDGSFAVHGAEIAQSKANGYNPDALIIGGSFDSTEQFPVRAILPGQAGGLAIYLQTDTAAMARTTAAAAQGSAQTLAELFKQGRFIRLVDLEGRQEFAVISNLTVVGNPPTTVIVQTTAAPLLQAKTPGVTCGYAGLGIGTQLNVITRVRYDLRSLAADPRFGGPNGIVTPVSAAVTGDAGRTELVRVELDANDNEIQQTLDIVAEYAVDLKFGISVGTTGINPTITRYPIKEPAEDPTIYAFANDVNAGGNPERIRSVQVRLTTRSRTPDRDADIPMAPFNVPDGRRYRFLVGANLPKTKYARLRTHYADVYLANQAGVQW